MRDLLAPDDTRDGLRKLGGLLFALGMLMLFLRKGGEYGDFTVFLILAIPAVFLYGVGTFGDRFTGRVSAWQAVYSVLGLVFVPLALLQWVELLGGSTSGWNTFWIFAVTAALGFYAGLAKGIRFQLLFGSIAAIVSWSGFWDWILSDGIGSHFGIYRGLLGILSILLLAAALHLWRTGNDARVSGTGVEDGGDARLWKASELFTGAGIAAVTACSLGISSLAEFATPYGISVRVVETGAVWDVLLLAVSLGLVILGTQIGTRGPVYVGALGLLFFLVIAGLDLDGDPPDPNALGLWPILLIVFGILGIAVGAVKEASLGERPRKLAGDLKTRDLRKQG